MKPCKRKLASSLALLIFFSATQLASAFYDPSLGRWLNRDPMGEVFDINLHRFVSNAPIEIVDINGLWGFGGLLSGAGEVGIGTEGAGATGNIGGGYFSGGGMGGFASGGIFAKSPKKTIKCPTHPQKPWAAGLYLGGGAGGFFTNAKKSSDLAGAFSGFNVNTPIGGFSASWGGGIFIGSVTVGPGAYASISGYPNYGATW